MAPAPTGRDAGYARFFRRDYELGGDGGRRLLIPMRHRREGGAPDAVAPAASIE